MRGRRCNNIKGVVDDLSGAYGSRSGLSSMLPGVEKA